LTVHADRGSAMRSKPVAFLLADLGVLRTHSRPYTSTDNPYSELIGGDSLLTDDDTDLLSAAVSTWRAYLDNPTDDAVVFAGVSNAGDRVAVSPDSTGERTASQKAKKNNSKRKRTSQSRNARCHCGSGLKSKRCCG
jgi:uncharacterized protein YchJ